MNFEPIKYVSSIKRFPLCHVVNLTLKTGIFRDELKTAKIYAVYKEGGVNNLQHYRPTSVLPVLSKFFELVIKNRRVVNKES